VHIRRIATGHDASGKAVIASDEQMDGLVAPGTGTIWRMWSADEPALYPDDGSDPGAAAVYPPLNGFRFHAFEIPAATAMIAPEDRSIDETGVSSVFEDGGDGMHRTDTTDLLVLMSGSVQLEVDDGVTTVFNAGDFIIQNGTRHKWTNVGDQPALFAAVTIGARRR
jgi:quercetin dioxygenase-like cupin family protein